MFAAPKACSLFRRAQKEGKFSPGGRQEGTATSSGPEPKEERPYSSRLGANGTIEERRVPDPICMIYYISLKVNCVSQREAIQPN